MTYASASNVVPYCRVLLKGAAGTTFDETTTPTISDVDDWLGMGYGKINSELASRGYAVPVTSAANCYNEVVQLEAMYAAAWAYLVRNVQAATGAGEAKGDFMLKVFNTQLDCLLSRDLSQDGIGHTSTAYAGGISRDDKATVEEDTDRVTPSFVRGVHDDPTVSWGAHRTSAS